VAAATAAKSTSGGVESPVPTKDRVAEATESMTKAALKTCRSFGRRVH
jgi:hypothetical protein